MPRSNTITLGPSSSTVVTLVGGGPDDADLITVAGLKALLAADVVVTDRLAPRALLAELAAMATSSGTSHPITRTA